MSLCHCKYITEKLFQKDLLHVSMMPSGKRASRQPLCHVLNFYLLQVTLHWLQKEKKKISQLQIAIHAVLLKKWVEPTSPVGAYIPIQGITINFQKFQEKHWRGNFWSCSLSPFRNSLYKKEIGGRQERRKRALQRPLLPKPPKNAEKRCDENMARGEGRPGNCFKTLSLFAVSNRNKQATETNDKELFHECNIEKGKKFLLGGQPVFLFVNYFSCFCLLEFTVQFNKLSSKTNKTYKIPNQHRPSPAPASEITCIRQGTSFTNWNATLRLFWFSSTHTPCTLTELLGLSVFALSNWVINIQQTPH